MMEVWPCVAEWSHTDTDALRLLDEAEILAETALTVFIKFDFQIDSYNSDSRCGLFSHAKKQQSNYLKK